MKVCNKCKKEKALSDFYARKDNPSGYQRACKKCILERQKVYLSTPEGKAMSIRKSASQYIKYRTKALARAKVSHAIRLGKITKPEKCSKCERKLKLEGHHDNYRKPLDVQWLCHFCHFSLHGVMTKEVE